MQCSLKTVQNRTKPYNPLPHAALGLYGLFVCVRYWVGLAITVLLNSVHCTLFRSRKSIGCCFQAAATIVTIVKYENKQHFYLRSLRLQRQILQVNISAVTLEDDIIGIQQQLFFVLILRPRLLLEILV